MSGIVCLFNRNGRPAAPSGATCSIDHRDLCADGDVAVAFDGRLDNREELTDRPTACSDAALVLSAYRRHAEAFASRLKGDFAAAVFDSTRQRLLLARDIMGTRRLHYCTVGDTVLAASDVRSLLRDPRVTARPDPEGVVDIVLDAWDDGRRTCFDGICSVPPGHVVIASAGGISATQHSAFDPSRTVRFREPAEYVDAFRSLFVQAVRRRLRSAGPVAVMVSGGLDSSSIFCQAGALARSQGRPVRGFAMTFPAETAANESTFLDALESGVGTITRLPHAEVGLLAQAEETVGWLETPGFAWDAQHQLLRCAAATGCTAILDGHFGDQMLSGHGYLVDLARHGQWRRVRRDLREHARWMIDLEPAELRRDFARAFVRSLVPAPVLQIAKRGTAWRRIHRYPPWYRKAHVHALLERQLERFDPGRAAGNHHAREYHQHATAGYYLAQTHEQSAVGLMHGIDVWYPYRDQDLVAFLMAIPGDIVNDGGVPKGLLRTALSGLLPDVIRDRRWKADFTALSNRGVVRDYTTITSVLTRDCACVRAGFVDGDALESGVAALHAQIATAKDAETAWQVIRTFGLELWLRRFFPNRFGLPCTAS